MTIADNTMKARHIPEMSIVRYEGRIGIVANNKNKHALIMWDTDNREGKRITPDTELEVIEYPAGLAKIYLADALVKQAATRGNGIKCDRCDNQEEIGGEYSEASFEGEGWYLSNGTITLCPDCNDAPDLEEVAA